MPSYSRPSNAKEKDPMGTAESYPSSLRPPRPFLQDQREPTSPLADKRRRTSQTSLVSRPESSPDGISSTTTSHISPIDIPLPPSTPRIQPYQDATEYPFATEHILHPFPSPPTQLTHMLENWQVFTPSPSSSTHQHGSGRNFSNVSLDVLPLSDLFDEAYITIENDSGLRKHRDQPTSSHKKLNARRDSPSPNSSFTTSPLSRTSAGMYFGTPNSTVSPIPFRQPSWPSSGERRANAPNSSPHFSSPLRTSISSRELLSTRLSSPSSLPSSAVPNKLDLTHIFSPACSLDCITHDAVFSAGASENCLDLTFGGPTTHIPVPTCPSTIGASSTAADYLRDRILDPEFTSRYIIRDELGAGGFGFVCSAIKTGYENVAEVDVAVKYIFKDRITMLDNNIVDGKPVEVYVLNRCDHPSIIGFYGLYEDPDFFYLVQEIHGDPWAPGHSLEPQTHAAQGPSSVPDCITNSFLPHMPISSPGSDLSVTSSPESPMTRVKRPPMGRRASHDQFEAMENQRFTEDHLWAAGERSSLPP